MHTLQTVILEHTTATGVHHDWMIEDPTLLSPKAPDARLWTARVMPPPQNWPKLKRFDLTVIPPHRRAYLDLQGPVSRNRGRVRRIARGTCVSRLWSASRIVLAMQYGSMQLNMELIKQTADHWTGIVSPAYAASEGLLASPNCS